MPAEVEYGLAPVHCQLASNPVLLDPVHCQATLKPGNTLDRNVAEQKLRLEEDKLIAHVFDYVVVSV